MTSFAAAAMCYFYAFRTISKAYSIFPTFPTAFICNAAISVWLTAPVSHSMIWSPWWYCPNATIFHDKSSISLLYCTQAKILYATVWFFMSSINQVSPKSLYWSISTVYFFRLGGWFPFIGSWKFSTCRLTVKNCWKCNYLQDPLIWNCATVTGVIRISTAYAGKVRFPLQKQWFTGSGHSGQCSVWLSTAKVARELSLGLAGVKSHWFFAYKLRADWSVNAVGIGVTLPL